MRRSLVLVVVTASLLGSPGLLDSFWSLVSSLWSGSSSEAGCGFAPWGECRTGSPTLLQQQKSLLQQGQSDVIEHLQGGKLPPSFLQKHTPL